MVGGPVDDFAGEGKSTEIGGPQQPQGSPIPDYYTRLLVLKTQLMEKIIFNHCQIRVEFHL